VSHDATLERTTNLRGPLSAFTAAELGRADAGYHFGPLEARPFRGRGHGIPRLDHVLSRYVDARIIIELKDPTVELVRATLDAVRAANACHRVCLGSFWLRAIRAARAMEPEVATSASREEVRWALYRSWVSWPVRRPPYRGYQVCEVAGLTRVVSPRFVDVSHRAGLPVQVWTVNTEEEARRLLSWGVDALITDRPDLMVPIVGGSRQSTVHS
jgi:glycerophosphoryl diester phosphodiesterase